MIEEKNEKIIRNSVMYFMLPMLQLNKSSFGLSNFINSYIDKAGYLAVDLQTAPSNVASVYEHEYYVTDYNTENGLRVIYSIPDQFKSDVRLFEEGKYSQFSPELKVLISKYSQLNSNDIHMKCLNPQKEDRQKLADDLGVRVELVRELKSAPAESNYIKIK